MSKLSSMTPVASILAIAITGVGLTACSQPMTPAATTNMTKAADASCGEAKCGAAGMPAGAHKAADASCGEGKCGAVTAPADAQKTADASCGEAKCGAAGMPAAAHKTADASCGEAKCGAVTGAPAAATDVNKP